MSVEKNENEIQELQQQSEHEQQYEQQYEHEGHEQQQQNVAGQNKSKSFVMEMMRHKASFEHDPVVNNEQIQELLPQINRDENLTNDEELTPTSKVLSLEQKISDLQAQLEESKQMTVLASQYGQRLLDENQQMVAVVQTLQEQNSTAQQQLQQEKLLREEIERKLEDAEYQMEQMHHTNEDLQLNVQEMCMTVKHERGKSGVLAVEKQDLENEMAQELESWEHKCIELQRENGRLQRASQEIKEQLRMALEQKNKMEEINNQLKEEIEKKSKHRHEESNDRNIIDETEELGGNKIQKPIEREMSVEESLDRAFEEERTNDVHMTSVRMVEAAGTEPKTEAISNGQHMSNGNHHNSHNPATVDKTAGEIVDTPMTLLTQMQLKHMLAESLTAVENNASHQQDIDRDFINHSIKIIRDKFGLNENNDGVDLENDIVEKIYAVSGLGLGTRDPSDMTVVKNAMQANMDKKKEMVNSFFNRYSNVSRWQELEETNYSNKHKFYAIEFITELDAIHCPLPFIYSLSMFLGQIIGIDQCCASFTKGLLLDGPAQSQWFADIYYQMEQKLKRTFDGNDDIYSFIFHLLSFTIFQYYQIESFVSLDINTRGLVDDLCALQQDKNSATKNFMEGWNINEMMNGFWGTFCCAFNKPSQPIVNSTQRIKDFEGSTGTNSEVSVELGADKIQENFTDNDHENLNITASPKDNIYAHSHVYGTHMNGYRNQHNNHLSDNDNDNDDGSAHEHSVIIHGDNNRENSQDNNNDMVMHMSKPSSKYSALDARPVDDELDEDSTGNQVHMIEYIA